MVKTGRKTGITNIVICGVGGQGIILASNVLCTACLGVGRDVKKSEVHGMAQRGGSVITHVRFGDKVYSPLIEEGTCDYMLAFEKLEALRYVGYLKRKSDIIVDDREIPPMSVLVGNAKYPTDVEARLARHGRTHLIPAGDVAAELGNPRVVNTVLLGVLARFLDLGEKHWHDAIGRHVKEQYARLNIEAFDRGRKLIG